MGLICAPIQAKSLSELRIKADKAAKFADLIEVWIDHLPSNTDPKEIMGAIKTPLLIVNKPKREKGLWKGSEKARVERLKQFNSAKIKYMDVGIDTNPTLIQDLKKNKKAAKLIVSYHNFNKTPSEKVLWKKVEKGFSLGADIVKIATFATKKSDNGIILSLLNRAKKFKKPLIVLCMGKYGKMSRVAGYKFGSKISYVAIDEKGKSAPGQLTHKEFDSLLKRTIILPLNK